jgi:hypothetical protein
MYITVSSNVLPHVLTLSQHEVRHTRQSIKCVNAQEFIHERKVKVWRQANQVALVLGQAHRHRMQGKTENVIRTTKEKSEWSNF